jgi:hypothetical protein
MREEEKRSLIESERIDFARMATEVKEKIKFGKEEL